MKRKKLSRSLSGWYSSRDVLSCFQEQLFFRSLMFFFRVKRVVLVFRIWNPTLKLVSFSFFPVSRGRKVILRFPCFLLLSSSSSSDVISGGDMFHPLFDSSSFFPSVFLLERPGVFYCFRDKKRMKHLRFRCSSFWTTTRFLTMKFLSRSLRTSSPSVQGTCRFFSRMRFPSDFLVVAPRRRIHSCVK